MNNRNGYLPEIPGISDVEVMPRRGFIRLGESMEERAEKGLNYPKELDHLGRIDASKDDAELYHSLYGENPNGIKIVFVSNQPTENFPQEFVSWNSRGQKTCYGNGNIGFERQVNLNDQAKGRLDKAKDEKEREYIESRLSPDDYDYSEKPISCQGFKCERYRNNKCQLEGTLKFLIVGMKGLRLFWIRTGSKWTMKTIRTMHENIRSLTSPNADPDFGRIRGIPLLLTREKKQYTLPNGIKTTKWVLSLDVADVGISDLLALATPSAITDKAKAAKGLLEGPEMEKKDVVNVEKSAEEQEEKPDVPEPQGPIVEGKEEVPENSKPVEDKKDEEKEGFDPQANKKDFVKLEKTPQIEVLQSLMKKKGYSKEKLKAPLDEFLKTHREQFYDTLLKMEDADDIPY